MLAKQIVVQGSHVVLAHAVFDTVTCHHTRLVWRPQAKLKLSQIWFWDYCNFWPRLSTQMLQRITVTWNLKNASCFEIMQICDLLIEWLHSKSDRFMFAWHLHFPALWLSMFNTTKDEKVFITSKTHSTHNQLWMDINSKEINQ